MADAEQHARIQRGREIWNAWRVENPTTNVDLRGADLSGANLSAADLREASLGGADLSGALLWETVLGNTNLRDARG